MRHPILKQIIYMDHIIWLIDIWRFDQLKYSSIKVFKYEWIILTQTWNLGMWLLNNDSMVPVVEFRPLGHQALSRFLIGWIPTTKRLLTLNLGAVWEIDLSINKNTIKPLKTHNSLSKISILANLAVPYSLKIYIL